MSDFQEHMKKVYQRFNYTIYNYQKLKDAITENPQLSQTQIGKLINRSQSYVNRTIKTYNYRESVQQLKFENYFYSYEKITEAKYIKIIEQMIKDTEKNKYLPLSKSSELCQIYRMDSDTISIYINYILSGISKEKYKEMIESL